jgi:copper chaperone NosL
MVTLLAGTLLGACGEREHGDVTKAAVPGELTREAIGYYCNMIVVDHVGPKGQVLIRGRDEPVWFTSVRDTIAFTLLPEEPKNIAAIYVNDMGRASWDQPEHDTWIDAREAWYVVGSRKVGGMGAPETVPFADRSHAEAFAKQHGGQVVAFNGVPTDYVLADAAVPAHGGTHQAAAQAQHATHESSTTPGGTGTDMPIQHAAGDSTIEVSK